MAMKRCDSGHYYDQNLHSTCPHCGISGLNIDPTRPLNKDKVRPIEDHFHEDETAGRAGYSDSTGGGHTIKKGGKLSEEGKTVGIIKKKLGIDPVVGWLVCIEGPDRGRDYRIHSGRNFIGRSQSMSIAITGDNSISRENHAIISYDPRQNQFNFAPGDSTDLSYLQGNPVYVPTTIQAYETIEMGETKLLFIPLCGDQFKWNTESS